MLCHTICSSWPTFTIKTIVMVTCFTIMDLEKDLVLSCFSMTNCELGGHYCTLVFCFFLHRLWFVIIPLLNYQKVRLCNLKQSLLLAASCDFHKATIYHTDTLRHTQHFLAWDLLHRLICSLKLRFYKLTEEWICSTRLNMLD